MTRLTACPDTEIEPPAVGVATDVAASPLPLAAAAASDALTTARRTRRFRTKTLCNIASFPAATLAVRGGRCHAY